MRIRSHLRTGFLVISIGTLVVALMSSEDLAWMFDPNRAELTSYSLPRTPWGDPDLQGAYTNTDERGIPMERPDQQGWLQSISTAVRGAGRARPARKPASTDWEPTFEAAPNHSRAWLVVDPADGKIPPLMPETSRRSADRAL